MASLAVRLSMKRVLRTLTLPCVVMLAVGVPGGCSGADSPEATERRSLPKGELESTLASSTTAVTVTRVVDGDTIEITPEVDGIEDVRLIGMDTPEISGECGLEPLAREAEDYAARYTGERVILELGEERTDPYGRLLAYVYVPDAGMLNERLVRRGLAQVATFPPNVRYEEEFLDAQERAREESAGIWGLPSGQQRLLADRGNGIGGGC